MGMLTEFKEFAMRGNVIDLAVGVVIARPSARS
jgi:large conductance mechanosensitive channel